MEVDLNKRYQSMIILWFALLMSVGMYFLVSILAGPKGQLATLQSSTLPAVLTALGALLVILSFAVKQKLLKRSVDNQDLGLVQKALIVACAMCEVAAVLGIIERFTVNSSGHYLLFFIAAAGIALHFPKRSHLEAASYKSRNIIS
jgi:hypothetical protein